MKKIILIFSLILASAAQAQPTTTKPDITNIISGTGVATALKNNLNASDGVVGPTPVRAGDVVYWNGTAWTTLAGNNSGTNCFGENSSGVPSWLTCSGGGGSPGGSSGQGQWNDGGSFGGYTVSGDMTAVFSTGVFTLNTVNANVGSFGSATNCVAFTTNAKGLITAASATTCTPAIASLTGLGTGVATALAINIGSAGAFVTFNGAGGTPSSLIGTNISGTASALSIGGNAATATSASSASSVPVGGITGAGAGCLTWLATASSANLRSCMTDETGTGVLYFQGGDAGTPSALVGTNISGTGASYTAGNATKLTTPRAISIGGTTGLTATGVNFDGSAAIAPALTGTLAVANGGTGDTGTAWASYTPTLSCGAGTLTTSSATGAYKQIGKTVFVRFTATITTNGTCATSLNVSLPAAPPAIEQTMAVRDVVNGQTGAARINSVFGNIAQVTRFDGVYLPISGSAVVGTGVYEAN